MSGAELRFGANLAQSALHENANYAVSRNHSSRLDSGAASRIIWPTSRRL